MAERTETRTSTTLLHLLRDPTDRAAWGRFCGRYANEIRHWCLRWGMQDADASDITQQLLSEIHTKLKNFVYDPELGRFRDWLRVVTHRACQSHFVQNRAQGRGALWDSIPASDDLAEGLSRVEQELDKEVHLERLREALGWVEQRVSTRDWGLFRQLSFGGRKPKDVGAELGMTVAAVYQVKYRVQKAVVERFHQLGGT
jgi:RNA polymerase sigma-70 factor (ECF subfamily)